VIFEICCFRKVGKAVVNGTPHHAHNTIAQQHNTQHNSSQHRSHSSQHSSHSSQHSSHRTTQFTTQLTQLTQFTQNYTHTHTHTPHSTQHTNTMYNSYNSLGMMTDILLLWSGLTNCQDTQTNISLFSLRVMDLWKW
jgi:hypothetical protein